MARRFGALAPLVSELAPRRARMVAKLGEGVVGECGWRPRLAERDLGVFGGGLCVDDDVHQWDNPGFLLFGDDAVHR